jgi:hypothetical protein
MDDKKLITFLYILLRDKLPSGSVEDIMEKHVEPTADKEVVYTNPHTEAHARWLAKRLLT